MLSVYLDQNKWIDLARVTFSRDVPKGHVDAASYLRSEVQNRRIRFPVSSVHIMEASRIGNRTKRLELGSVFTTYSDGWFLLGRPALIAHEIQSALADLLGVRCDAESPFSPFRRDFLLAFADYPSLSSLLNRRESALKDMSAALGPVLSLISFLEFPDEDNRQTAIRRMTASNDELIEGIRARRARWADESAHFRLRAYSAMLFFDIQDKIQVALTSLGRTVQDLRALPDDQIAGLLNKMPCLDIERRLAVQVEQQSSRELQGNDIYDIAWLSAAIPYCDIVVTEKLWVHSCRVCGIDNMYRTQILRSLTELIESLQLRTA
jgi:hypothetical protein